MNNTAIAPQGKELLFSLLDALQIPPHPQIVNARPSLQQLTLLGAVERELVAGHMHAEQHVQDAEGLGEEEIRKTKVILGSEAVSMGHIAATNATSLAFLPEHTTLARAASNSFVMHMTASRP